MWCVFFKFLIYHLGNIFFNLNHLKKNAINNDKLGPIIQHNANYYNFVLLYYNVHCKINRLG